MGTVVIDPITRIEGHLKIEAEIENGVVTDARSTGTLFRGWEIILKNRDPRDAKTLTQRVCGVCPIAHGYTSALCLDSAFGIAGDIPDNGRLIRNLIFGSNFIQSHILHFYHLAALDYVDVTLVAEFKGSHPILDPIKDFIARGALGPFVPRYEGDYRIPANITRQLVIHYVQALDMRRKAHEMLAIFGGKMPHECGIISGGATIIPTTDKIANFLWRLNEVRDFIDRAYIPDVLAVAAHYPDYFGIGKGCGNFIAYGSFEQESGGTDYLSRKRLLNSGFASIRDLTKVEPVDANEIREYVKHSWFSDEGTNKHPLEGVTIPEPGKRSGYSWLKSPRYKGRVAEVGPLSRMLVEYLRGNETVKGLVDPVLEQFKADAGALVSVLGRHAARAIECKVVADAMISWVTQLKPGERSFIDPELPEEAQGIGMSDAPRGALLHALKIKNKVIDNYQLVVPTTWNASPRDDMGQPGPIEQAIIGTKIKDESNPFEIVRIVRSFDPCLACAVHLVAPRGKKIGEFRVF